MRSTRFSRVHSYVALAFGMLMIMALWHSNLASGEMPTEKGWNDWSRPWKTSFLAGSPSDKNNTSGWSWSVLLHQAYVWERSTEENYQSLDFVFHGKYAHLRTTLDYTYHSNYSRARQFFHDEIIDSMLNGTWITDKDGRVCTTATQPWIVFTAGAMGAGKSYTVRQLAAKGLFPLQSFVTVDPDEIRRHLPEFELYMERHPERAGEWTRKEAGYIAELLTLAALGRGQNVLVDGSLRDYSWYQGYFSHLRQQSPKPQIGILHITAPREIVFQRAKDRSRMTGRIVPDATLELAVQEVPRSIQVLEPLADFFCELHNAHDADSVAIVTEGFTWESFQHAWSQTCPIRASTM